MTKKDKTRLYNFATIMLLISCAGRTSVAIILYLGIIFVSVFGTLLDSVFKKFASGYAKSVWQLTTIVLLCAIYQQIVMLYSPLMEIYTGFSIYLIAFSSFILNSINSEKQDTLVLSLKENSVSILKFCLYTSAIFVMRDYIGYGTLTLPFFDRFIELYIPHPKIMEQTFFWGSIPFGIILLALMISLITLMSRVKFHISRGKKK